MDQWGDRERTPANIPHMDATIAQNASIVTIVTIVTIASCCKSSEFHSILLTQRRDNPHYLSLFENHSWLTFFRDLFQKLGLHNTVREPAISYQCRLCISKPVDLSAVNLPG